jgi:DNA-binding MarR family transcriptional regulator
MKQPAADRIVRAVLSLGRRLRAERPAAAPSLSTIGILSALSRAGAMPATRLAAEEHLQPQSLTRIIGRLERAGWIARKRNTADRRELAIALTARGRRVLDAEVRARRAWLSRALATALTPAERATLVEASDAMQKLANHRGDGAIQDREGSPDNSPRHRG